MNEAGKFFVLPDCIMTREDQISFLMGSVMFACLWFLLVHQNLAAKNRTSMSTGIQSKTSQVISTHTHTGPVILCQISIVPFFQFN